METLLQDIRYAVRSCARAPGFTAIAVLALALGIGANTAIFTIVHAALLERLPYRDADRVVAVWETSARRPGRSNTVGPANFLRWGERATVFEGLAAFADTRINLTDAGDPVELAAQLVTAPYFSVLGVPPALGRVFSAEESGDPRSSAVILSDEVWRQRFGGDPSIVGRAIRLNTLPKTVVGVMPPGFRLFFKSGSLTGKPVDVWLPMVLPPDAREPHGRYLSVVGKLKPSVSIDAAKAQMASIAASLATELPEFDTGWSAKVVPLRDELSGELRPALLVLSGAVAFVLLIACANVANLLLARGAARQREVAIRVALGAARRRIVRQLLTESLVLGAAGGAAGLLVAQWSLALLIAISPVDLTSIGHIELSYPVLLFTAAVSILTAIACGLAPAFEGSRADVQETIKEGGWQVGAGVRHRRMRHAFVVAEIALAVVLLVGAGLMARSFDSLSHAPTGFDATNVLTMRAQLPLAKYKDDAQRIRFFKELTSRVREIPGVRAAGAISYLPLAGLGAATRFTIDGQPPPPPGQDYVTDVRVCDNGFFEALGIRLLRGRLFTDREMLEPSHVVVVNEALVREYFPHEDPLGKRLSIEMTDPPIVPTTIVGVVADVKVLDMATPARSTTYWPHPQLAYSAMTLTVRTRSDPQSFAGVVEHQVHEIDKDQPVSEVRTMQAWVSRSLAQSRFNSLVLAFFAGLALLLAAIGIYGVMSYAVSQRTSEIGIRLALGADERRILRLIVGDGITLALIGLAVGVALSLALTRTLTALLFGTAPTDPLTFGAVIALLGSVALLASYLPARRAARIAPLEALRART
jgi:putative ABC transport system permease protein